MWRGSSRALSKPWATELSRGACTTSPSPSLHTCVQMGGEIRTGSRVDKIVVKNNRAVAVRLADGEEIGVSQVVAANTDPRQAIVDFLGEEHVGSDLIQRMQRYEWGDAYFVIYLALDGPLIYRAGADADRSAYVHPTPPTMDYLSRIYTECRGGMLPAAPLVLMCNDSAIDPNRSPANKAVMKVIALNVPYDIKGDSAGRDPRANVGRGEGGVCRSPHRPDHGVVRSGPAGPDSETSRSFAGGHGACDPQRGAGHRQPRCILALSVRFATSAAGTRAVSNTRTERLPVRVREPPWRRHFDGSRPKRGPRHPRRSERKVASATSGTPFARTGT